MKARILLLVMMAIIVTIIGVIATPAQAVPQTNYFEDGSYAVANSAAGPIKSGSQTLYALRGSGGTGGSASSSGSRTAWIKTTMYSITHIPIVDIKSISNWSWKGGVVTAHSWDEPQVNKRVGAFNITYNVKYGQSGWRTWNNRAHGCWYQTIKFHVVHSVLKIGIISEWDVLHQYRLYGNGTYRWSSNY